MKCCLISRGMRSSNQRPWAVWDLSEERTGLPDHEEYGQLGRSREQPFDS